MHAAHIVCFAPTDPRFGLLRVSENNVEHRFTVLGEALKRADERG